jgi:hypothetical protein
MARFFKRWGLYAGGFLTAVIFAVWTGPTLSALNLLQYPTFNHRCEITSGVREPECRDLLQCFFAEQRRNNKQEKTNRDDGAS